MSPLLDVGNALFHASEVAKKFPTGTLIEDPPNLLLLQDKIQKRWGYIELFVSKSVRIWRN